MTRGEEIEMGGYVRKIDARKREGEREGEELAEVACDEGGGSFARGYRHDCKQGDDACQAQTKTNHGTCKASQFCGRTKVVPKVNDEVGKQPRA